MKTKLLKLICSTLAVAVATTSVAFASTVNMTLNYDGKNHAYSAEEVKILVNDEELKPADMPAVIVDGRTMLPMRLIAQALGCEVLWDEASSQAFIISDTSTVMFSLSAKTAYKNGEPLNLDVPALLINDRTMLPVRALANALDLEVVWNESTRTVSINNGKVSVPTADPIEVKNVVVPESETSKQVFTIEASGGIYSYEEVYLDDTRVVIDIYNATSSLSSIITETNSNVVKSIRSSEQISGTTPYTRVVLDLTGKKNYKITQSTDKTKIYITFENVIIENIALSKNGSGDRVVVTADTALGATVSTLTNPQRVVIEVQNALSELPNILEIGELNTISSATTKTTSSGALQIILELSQFVNVSHEESDGIFTLKLTKSTLQNMAYDATKEVLVMGYTNGINENTVIKNDRHTEGYYEITLPGNFENIYGYGTIAVSNGNVKNIKISSTSKGTTIRFEQNRYNEYIVEVKDNSIEIHVKNPKDVYDRVVLLDAGHGAEHPGAIANGITEKSIVLDIVLKIGKYLEGTNVKVYYVRDSDTRMENNLRAQTANQISDLMVSIHMNSVANITSANGTETLYQVHSNDNQSKLTSLKAAELIQSAVVSALNTTNRGVKQRTDLMILNGTTVPAVLLEVCFISNPGDALKISQTANQDAVAKAVANSIVAALNNYSIR